MPGGKPNSEVSLVPVDGRNWRDVAALKVREDQAEFVAPPAYYLCLCHYGGLWNPLAVVSGGMVVGFLMWAVDDDDGSCWLGGIIIDENRQGLGLGSAAVRAAVDLLARDPGCSGFALSYAPENAEARHVYASIGFRETGEREDDEVVARLSLRG